MNTLIVTLPAALARETTEYDFVLGAADQPPAAQGRSVAVQLPRTVAAPPELVVLLPARALSWLPFELPQALRRSLLRPGADPRRQRAVLAGLLEDRLLDEVEPLHLAVFAGDSDEAPAWAAACDRAWLQSHLQLLEQAGHAIIRIVPEFAPRPSGLAPLAVATAALDPAELVLCSAAGVAALPLGAAALALAQQAGVSDVHAEPQVAQLAEQAFAQAPILQTETQRRLQAGTDHRWNLAQFEFAVSRRLRWRKRLLALWQTLSQDRRWRPARYALGALLLVQVIGLNTLAFQRGAEMRAMRTAMHETLVQTFPQVPLVLDAPAQMRRELDTLRAAAGQSGGVGLADVLMQIARLAPDFQPLERIELNDGTLQLRGPALSADELDALAARLSALGWKASRQDAGLLISMRSGA